MGVEPTSWCLFRPWYKLINQFGLLFWLKLYRLNIHSGWFIIFYYGCLSDRPGMFPNKQKRRGMWGGSICILRRFLVYKVHKKGGLYHTLIKVLKYIKKVFHIYIRIQFLVWLKREIIKTLKYEDHYIFAWCMIVLLLVTFFPFTLILHIDNLIHYSPNSSFVFDY